MTRSAHLCTALLLLSLPLAACEQDGEPAETGETVAEDEAFDGLSPEQIRDAAEPMSPEKAEELGIIDTMIHLEDPVPGDPVAIDPVTGDTLPEYRPDPQ